MKNRSEYRKRAALTQVQLARLTGVPQAHICFWENGDMELRPDQVSRIAAVLAEHLDRTPAFGSTAELARALAPNMLGVGAAA